MPANQLNQHLIDLSTKVGKMQNSLDDMKTLQKDVVELLRKHDKTDGVISRLSAVVENHEKELNTLRYKRIGDAAKREYLLWWLNNWKNVALLFLTFAGAVTFIFPQLKAILGV